MNESLPLFVTVGNALDSAMGTFIAEKVALLIQTITPWALGAITIWLTLYGYSILAGRIQQPMQEGVWKAVWIVLIVSVALNSDRYLSWVVETMQSFQKTMTGVVTGEENISLWEALDGALDRGFALFNECVLKAMAAGFMEMGACLVWLMAAIMILVSFGIIVVVGGSMIFVASALLKITLSIGPLFLLCLMFAQTREWFSSWFSKCVTLILQVVLTACLMAVALRIYEEIIKVIDISAAGDQNALKVSAFLIGVSLLLTALLRESGRLAGDLGGRLSSELMTFSGLAHSATAPGRAVKQAINPTSARLDPSTGRHLTSSRAEHAVMGRTVASPAYRKIVLENIRTGWKKPS